MSLIPHDSLLRNTCRPVRSPYLAARRPDPVKGPDALHLVLVFVPAGEDLLSRSFGDHPMDPLNERLRGGLCNALGKRPREQREVAWCRLWHRIIQRNKTRTACPEYCDGALDSRSQARSDVTREVLATSITIDTAVGGVVHT